MFQPVTEFPAEAARLTFHNVACGAVHTAVVAATGEVFAWGANFSVSLSLIVRR